MLVGAENRFFYGAKPDRNFGDNYPKPAQALPGFYKHFVGA